MDERGFLLVEVLLALLVAAAFGALAVSFRTQAAAAELAAHEATAVFLAQKRRAFVLEAGGALADEAVTQNGALFAVTSREVGAQEPGGARGVLVEVRWQERGQVHCVSLPVAADAAS